MRHTILSVAYPLTPVGPDAAGGSEQILTLLDEALCAAGHTSLVIAAEGSKVLGTLIASPAAAGPITETDRIWAQRVHRQLIQETLARHSVDLIHMHSLDFHCYLPSAHTPVLATLHLPPDWYPSGVFRHPRGEVYLNCVSSYQQRGCPASSSLLPHIPNGVAVERFTPKTEKNGYALSLGRICPEKGFHFALDAAKKARIELVLAGVIYPYDHHEQYFALQIKPRLDARRRFIGPVGFQKKRRLLAQAKCLLIPSTVAETSSLVAMEALASGTPVVAFPSGALPEIIEHGRTGYIVSSVEEMAEAIRMVKNLDPAACRSSAMARFSARVMIDKYFETYDRLIGTVDYREDYRVRPGVSWLV
jgi:glycosyltransferase involved in cell wall biosynthesis